MSVVLGSITVSLRIRNNAKEVSAGQMPLIFAEKFIFFKNNYLYLLFYVVLYTMYNYVRRLSICS